MEVSRFFTTYEGLTPPPNYRVPDLTEYKEETTKLENPLQGIHNNYVTNTTMDITEPISTESISDNDSSITEQKDPLVPNYGTKPKRANYNSHTSKFSDQVEFSKVMDEAYKKGLKKAGLDPRYSTMLVAQDSLESGYGSKAKGNFNFGNIAAGDLGQGYVTSTSGLKFSNYKSIDDYVDHKIKTLQKERYNFFKENSPTTDVATAMQRLADQGYCPNTPGYGLSIAKVYNSVLSNLKTPSKDKKLISIDIEDLLRQEGITEVNGKKIKFGSKEVRGNVSYGSSKSHHKTKDPHTGNANARDISIENGNIQDYAALRKKLLSNNKIKNYMGQKGWGIINEITPDILSRTKGTGMHFHFGPDKVANKTWQAWLANPNIDITKSFLS